jgi:hypothetical protein
MPGEGAAVRLSGTARVAKGHRPRES